MTTEETLLRLIGSLLTKGVNMKMSQDPITYISREDWENVGKCLLLLAQSMATHRDIKRIENMLVQLGAKNPKASKK